MTEEVKPKKKSHDFEPGFGITSGCICGKCDSCERRGVPPGETMEETIEATLEAFKRLIREN